ncbi:hypothetical protein HLH34_04285 [Gluconacetobacter azotocaptans]|uniref:Uncharacterized protein n=1 Tax=Gluconacetobacter azotocaptans TaxID=142834 RepID=A0A7W4JQR1_9PROT|nr:hypothetical protein [Gluconacetobacter azotocaptans]MBB2189182.1 hypothetical protein [Gluconacetobacter azotocaptans]GBQ32174.1 hypothetical protein AA13594_2291 [Gluconacetobacter azotocaptans DSM 13594]
MPAHSTPTPYGDKPSASSLLPCRHGLTLAHTDLLLIIASLTGASDSRGNAEQVRGWLEAAQHRTACRTEAKFLVVHAVARAVMPGHARYGLVATLHRMDGFVREAIACLPLSADQRSGGQ